MRVLLQWVCCALLAGAAVLPAEARRLALVIGNDGYQQLQRLERSGNDAEALARALQASGFEVSLHRDLARQPMRLALQAFMAQLRAGDEAVVSYTGHAIQTERGALLLPVDIAGEDAARLEQAAYPLNQLIAELGQAQLRFSLVIIDACRDNPLQAQGRNIGLARGLVAPAAARNQMLILSAGPNQASLDALHDADRHPNGVFARALLQRLGQADRSIARVATEVRLAVEQAARSIRREQRPQLIHDAAAESWNLASRAGTGTITTAARSPGVPPTPTPGPTPPTSASAVPQAPVAAISSDRQQLAYTLANGDRYLGEVVGTMRTGKGRYTFANGDVYEGGFLDNLHHGQGVLSLANGDRYEGSFVNGIRQGQGTYRFANGDTYTGSFVQGLFEGRGRLSQANGDLYEGEFSQGMKQGYGIHLFASRDRYEGSFRHGAQHGMGTHFYASGDRYVGEFANGVRSGRGIYHFASGEARPMAFVNGVEMTP